MLKPPGTKRLKPKHDETLSNVAFKFNMRRYIMGAVVSHLGGAVQVDPIKPDSKPRPVTALETRM
jgi:hypothetical protein